MTTTALDAWQELTNDIEAFVVEELKDRPHTSEQLWTAVIAWLYDQLDRWPQEKANRARVIMAAKAPDSRWWFATENFGRDGDFTTMLHGWNLAFRIERWNPDIGPRLRHLHDHRPPNVYQEPPQSDPMTLWLEEQMQRNHEDFGAYMTDVQVAHVNEALRRMGKPEVGFEQA